MNLGISKEPESQGVTTRDVSIITLLREAQASAKERKEAVVSAGLHPKEWLQFVQELRDEGTELSLSEDATLEHVFGGTRVFVDLSGPWLQAFTALFVIRERYGKVCENFDLCTATDCPAKDACRGVQSANSSSCGSWLLANEALQAFANEFFFSKPEA